MEESSNTTISEQAKDIRQIVNSNKPKLMTDEQEGLASMGIETNEYLVELGYSENTERLSALWHYETRGKDDAMRVALKCPPEDVEKKQKVEEWMKSEPDRLARVQEELEKS